MDHAPCAATLLAQIVAFALGSSNFSRPWASRVLCVFWASSPICRFPPAFGLWGFWGPHSCEGVALPSKSTKESFRATAKSYPLARHLQVHGNLSFQHSTAVPKVAPESIEVYSSPALHVVLPPTVVGKTNALETLWFRQAPRSASCSAKAMSSRLQAQAGRWQRKHAQTKELM